MRFVFRIVWSLKNLTDTLAAMLPVCLSNFEAMQWFKLPISRHQGFTRSHDKVFYQILKQGPVYLEETGHAIKQLQHMNKKLGNSMKENEGTE